MQSQRGQENGVRRAVLTGYAMLLSVLAGCSRVADSPSLVKRPFEGMVVRIAVPATGPGSLIQQYGRAWCERSGATIQINPEGESAAKLTVDAADLRIIPASDLGKWASAPPSKARLEPVPTSFTSQEAQFAWLNMLAVYRNQLLVWNDRPVAMPIVGSGLVCCYRSDLFGDPEHRAAFQERYHRQLAAPATWQEYADIATFFADRWRQPSLPPLPTGDTDLVTAFHTAAAPFVRQAVSAALHAKSSPAALFSYEFDAATGEPRIDTPGFVEALRLTQRLAKCRPVQPLAQPLTAFRAGTGVICLASPAWIRQFQEADSAIRDKVALCPVPGSQRVAPYLKGTVVTLAAPNMMPYLDGGWLGVVPAGASAAAAAFDLLAEFAGPTNTGRQILLDPIWGGGPFRREHFDNEAAWLAFGLDTATTHTLRLALQQRLDDPQIINPVLCLRLPEHATYLAELAEVLRRCQLNQDSDPEAELKRLASLWKTKSIEPSDQRRQQYRLSIGLEGR